ncbi:hypothetical protein TNIN_459261 [Trichonephila inaurata madagascariensis]|uniref:Uncharacterized protein n=1 Tax=Trichonephila inaurata madagascariensis TaxID=2747483 RepID=A0A8X6IE81_9ARAC|nr:hypothetical protein TNIN_459261 [Trichonephila inaurata madagascariensis]
MQKVSRPLSFHSTKNLIKRLIKACAQEDLYNPISHKSWWNAVLYLCNGPRRRAVTESRLATGQDCLRNHLYRIKVVPSPICTLYSSGEIMSSAHLVHCPALHKTFFAERYWEARDMRN